MSEDTHDASSRTPVATRLEVATCLHELRLVAHNCQSNADFPGSVSLAMSESVWRNTAFHLTALCNRLEAALPGVQPDSDAPTDVVRVHSPHYELDAERAFSAHLQAQFDAVCSERDALRMQLAACRSACRAVLEAARPCLKHAAVDGSPDALAALDLIAAALAPLPIGSNPTPSGTPAALL